MNCQTNFHPTKNHLNQIEKWLIDELEANGQGFYHNWNIINSAYDENNLIVLTENGFAIGFIVYKINECIIEICIAVMKQNYQKKGLGRRLIDDTLNEFQKKGILVCELFCSPANSKHIWKRLGFQNFPDFPHNTEIRMFKPLVSTAINSEINNLSEKILLWDSIPNLAEKENPKWTWNLTYKENSTVLSKPIIFPAFYNWQICWKKKDEIKYKGKIKKFEYERIEFGRFIIITSLRK